MAREKCLILFVEDSPTQALSVQLMLEKTGLFNVQLAKSAMEGLEFLQEDVLPDAIISDIVMPEITGFEFTAAIRNDNRLQHIPVLLTTSKASRDNMLEGLKCGANGFIPKPMTDDLPVLLNYLIDNNRVRANTASNGTAMKIGDEIHNISADKTQLIDMLYSSMHTTDEKSRRLEECYKELRDVKNQLRQLKMQGTSPASGSKGGKILVVDDANINRMICSRLLASLGYDHEVVESAKQVLELVKERYNDFDLIFTDCQMPEMDGFEMTRIIRKFEKDNNFKQKPIVALTANVHENDQNLCYEAGMNDFLSKPFRKDDIGNCIKKWIEKNKD